MNWLLLFPSDRSLGRQRTALAERIRLHHRRDETPQRRSLLPPALLEPIEIGRVARLHSTAERVDEELLGQALRELRLCSHDVRQLAQTLELRAVGQLGGRIDRRAVAVGRAILADRVEV